jgi:hypothetical protein
LVPLLAGWQKDDDNAVAVVHHQLAGVIEAEARPDRVEIRKSKPTWQVGDSTERQSRHYQC